MPIVDTKEEVLRNLECTKHSFYLGTFGVLHLMYDMMQKKDIPNLAVMPESQIGLCDFGWENYIKQKQELLKLDSEFISTFTDTYNSLERNYIKESFEFIQNYCYVKRNGIDQSDKLKAQPWYEVARLFRNSLSHNWVLDFRKKETDYLEKNREYRYKNIVVKKEDEGKSLYELGWNRFETMCLCDEMIAFAKSLD